MESSLGVRRSGLSMGLRSSSYQSLRLHHPPPGHTRACVMAAWILSAPASDPSREWNLLVPWPPEPWRIRCTNCLCPLVVLADWPKTELIASSERDDVTHTIVSRTLHEAQGDHMIWEADDDNDSDGVLGWKTRNSTHLLRWQSTVLVCEDWNSNHNAWAHEDPCNG